MSSINILHWSNTPLVGSPSTISNCINRVKGFSSHHVCEKDYPNNGFLFKEFTNNSIVINDMTNSSKQYLEHLIRCADIIHIHNEIEEKNLLKIKNINKDCIYIYHVHSPLHEGPLFFPRYKKYKDIFSAFLVVAQYQPRIYNDFIPVPNIIDKNPSLQLLTDDEPIRVTFSPTHIRPGRWNNKFSEILVETLSCLDKLKLIDYVEINGERPNSLFNIRKMCHVSFDEIVTGAFHQVSLESLIAGNLTINAADFFSKLTFSKAIGSPQHPPFYLSHPNKIRENMLYLINNRDVIRDYQLQSHEYAKKYLDPEVLVKKYTDLYKEVLSVY